jgi:hypothetical protein
MEITKENFHKMKPQKASKDLLNNLEFNFVKGKQAFLVMENGDILGSFFYNDNGKACAIPLANPVLIYFNLAQSHLRDIVDARKSLLGLFRDKKTDVNEDSLRLFYQYFGLTSTFVVMLMTAVEAFVNQKIDQDFKYEKPDQNKCMRVFDYEQIQRWIPLNEKIESILNKIFSKNFAKAYPLKQQHFNNLKELRDLIVHTKAEKHFESYIEVYRKTLKFNFNETIEAMKDFINYYEMNLIEPCPCSQQI